ncbi:MAG: hypothetical protein GAK43_02145 [Stenotrophomonas maltophilia]|nr:MAG: hypothetical protein GAK43_02145 [Stenotrophomonas maltophilia]
MDTSPHTFAALFKQLGLPEDRHAIDDFIANHRLEKGQALYDAPFWSTGQAAFLRESLARDSDWAETVDELAVRLEQ